MRALALLLVGVVPTALVFAASHGLSREQVWMFASGLACVAAVVGAIRNTPGDRVVAIGMPFTVCSLAVLSGLTDAGLAANVAGLLLNAFVLRRIWSYLGAGTDGRGVFDAVVVAATVCALLLLGADLSGDGNVVRAVIFAGVLALLTRTVVSRGTVIGPFAMIAAAVLSWTVGLAVELHSPESMHLRAMFVALAWVWLGSAPLHPGFADLCGPPELRRHRRALLRLLLYLVLLLCVVATLALAPAGPGATAGRVAVAALVSGVMVWRVVELLRHGDRDLAAVRRRTLTDPLTGLANRTGLIESLRAVAGDGHSAVLLVDVDGFRTLNDGLGATVGDRLLTQVAERLREAAQLRGVVARVNADEFAVHHRHTDDADDCLAFAALIQDAVAAPVPDGTGFSLPLQVSIGMAPVDPTDVDASLRNAQVALTTAKRTGRGRIAWYDPAMAEDAHDRALLLTELHEAIGRGQLHLVFQPIVDVHTRRMVAVEALLRWHHPTRGPVPPTSFIPLAESAGLIVPLGRWVVGEALRVAADLRRSGWPDLAVHVNVSPVQLRDDGQLHDHVRAALGAHGVPPSGLLVEITEGVLVDGDASLHALHQLRESGIRIGLDDFGSGYASINYLDRLELDVVKLDRLVTGRIGRHDRVGTGVLHLLRTLPFTVVAEGVEDATQIAALRHGGCHLVQGYAVAPPLEEAALRAWADGAGPGRRPTARLALAVPTPRSGHGPSWGDHGSAADTTGGGGCRGGGGPGHGPGPTGVTVGELTTVTLRVDDTTTCGEVDRWFARQPLLATVLVGRSGEAPRLLTRELFDRHMRGALGFGRALSTHRPVAALDLPPSRALPASTGLLDAVDAALSRPADGRAGDLLVHDEESDVYTVLSVVRLLDTTGRCLSDVVLRDPLTGLASRARFVAELHRVAGSGRGHHVVVVDLDGFRTLNNRYGHDVGDAVLRTVGTRLAARLARPYLPARTAADEFAVLLPDETDPAVARRVAARIVQALTEPVTVGSHRLVVTASTGVAGANAGDGPMVVLERAGEAVAAARAARRRAAIPA